MEEGGCFGFTEVCKCGAVDTAVVEGEKKIKIKIYLPFTKIHRSQLKLLELSIITVPAERGSKFAV